MKIPSGYRNLAILDCINMVRAEPKLRLSALPPYAMFGKWKDCSIKDEIEDLLMAKGMSRKEAKRKASDIYVTKLEDGFFVLSNHSGCNVYGLFRWSDFGRDEFKPRG